LGPTLSPQEIPIRVAFLPPERVTVQVKVN
jgi:hypothetical protein